MPLLRVDALSKRFGPTVALDGVSFALDASQVHALIGENGAGKSTLMNLLAGALQPDSGRMAIAGSHYAPASPHDASRAGIALIHQELSLCPHLTVAENILLGMEPARLGLIRRADMRRTATDVLARLGHPEIAVDAPVATLSPLRSNSLRSAARSRSAAGYSCSTNRRAA